MVHVGAGGDVDGAGYVEVEDELGGGAVHCGDGDFVDGDADQAHELLCSSSPG